MSGVTLTKIPNIIMLITLNLLFYATELKYKITTFLSRIRSEFQTVPKVRTLSDVMYATQS